MLAYTYIEHGKFGLLEKPIPVLEDARDAIVRVTLGSICTSDLHIKHGSVPRAVPGITVGHEMVGIVEQVGAEVESVKPGDRVTVNVETFCGKCFFCRHGYVNNCTDTNGGWALGCRIDGGQAEYVRVPYADQGLNRIPDTVSDEQALLVGDVLATGFWAARISEITEEDTVLIIGAGPTGICTLLCSMLKKPRRIIVCEQSAERIRFVREHYPEVLVIGPENCKDFVRKHSDHGGADVVLEVAGTEDTFRLAWECARPNAIVTIVADLTLKISFKAYLFQSARNRCLNALRDEKDTVPIEGGEEYGYALAADTSVEMEELNRLIEEAVCSLPDKCGQVYRKSREEGKTNQEIAGEMGISVKTVEAQITKALKHIKKFLGEQYTYLF